MRYWLMKSEPDELSIDDLARAPRQRGRVGGGEHECERDTAPGVDFEIAHMPRLRDSAERGLHARLDGVRAHAD